MPRKQPQPFSRSQTQYWYVQLGKKQVRLGPNKETAFRRYHEPMAKPPAVAELVDRFLDRAHHNRERPTYEAYKRRLQFLIDSIPPASPCGELKPYHITRVMDAKAWGANTKHDFAVAVQPAYNMSVR